MFREAVWQFINLAAEAHDAIEALARRAGLRMGDKDLHFWVFGVSGALLMALAWRLFWRLRRHTGVSAFLFSLVTMTLLALAVEMGQQISGRSRMDMRDIGAGVAGFLVLGGALAAAVLLFLGARRLWRRERGPRGKTER